MTDIPASLSQSLDNSNPFAMPRPPSGSPTDPSPRFSPVTNSGPVPDSAVVLPSDLFQPELTSSQPTSDAFAAQLDEPSSGSYGDMASDPELPALDSQPLADVYDSVKERYATLVQSATENLGAANGHDNEVVDLILYLRDCAEIPQLKEKIAELRQANQIERMVQLLGRAERHIADFKSGQMITDNHIAQFVADSRFALAREQEGVGNLKVDVDFLTVNLAALEKRIALMTHAKSGYGQARSPRV
jgi:hypothetical protein